MTNLAPARAGTEVPVVDVLRGFLRAQRVGVTDPVAVQHDLSLIVTDDDHALVNTYLVYEPGTGPGPGGEIALDREALGRAVTDPPRTVLVVPDRLFGTTKRLSQIADGLVQRVVALHELLDGFLRPLSVCDELTGGHGTNLLDSGLLNSDDFIPQRASVPGRGHVDAINYLFNGWAKGTTPRLCIVLAPAGHGKSKITHILAKRLATHYQQADGDARPPVPILIPFGQYRRTTSFTGLIFERLNRFGKPLLTIDAFQYLVSLGRVLFILDGYDEMVESNPETARDNIADFVQHAGPESRILLTSRSTFYRTATDVVGQVGDPLLVESDVEVIDLLPFDRAQARAYLRKRISDGPDRSHVLERAQRILDEDKDLEILGSPIFLAEFADSVTREQWSMTDIRRHGTLKFLVGRTFARERERQGHDFTDDEQRRFLEGIAFDLLTSAGGGYLREDLELFVAEAVDDQSALANWAALASHHFLLPDERAGSTTITMRHQVWRDYFQGSALANRLCVSASGAVEVIADRDLPEGVLRSADGLIDEQTRARLTAQAAKGGDKLLRNLLRMSLLRREPDRTSPAPLPAELRDLLAGRDLSGITFLGVDFGGTDLSRANLAGCYLLRCDLTGARLTGAMLDRTTLRDCTVDAGIAEAVTASVTIDDTPYFGPQLRDLYRPAAAQPDGGAEPAGFAGWVVQVLHDRLGKFIKARVGENNVAVDEAISWTAFMGGTDPQHKDFVVRRLYRAMRAEHLVYEGRMNSGGRPTVCLTADPDVRTEVVAFVRGNTAGPVVQAVIDRLVR